MGDPSKWLDLVKDCKYLPENDFKKLCELVSDILIEEPNMQPVSSPVTVCGDIHGQFYDLEELFRTGGPLPETRYIFLGDYVDRGHYSLECFTRLLTLKLCYPSSITLLRGNHECRQITKVYGFYDECMAKYGNANGWKHCCAVFDLLAVAALIDGQVLCVHGGLSPEVRTLDQLNTINRNCEIPFRGAFCDLLWSDPEDIDFWGTSPRGAGWLFGRKVTDDFMDINKLSLICRAHQLVHEGLRYVFDRKVVTVWSAPNYCYRCGNVAAILSFDADLESPTQKIFEAVDDDKRVMPKPNASPYFL